MSASEGGHLGNPRPAGQIMFEVLAEQSGAFDLIRKYEEAAEAYENAKKSDFLKKEINDIISFVNSKEWKSILKLLKASEEEIQIGFDFGAHGEIGYFLNKDGFVLKFTESSNCLKVVPIITSSSDITEEKVLSIARAFRKKFARELHSFYGFVFGKLGFIVDACPK